MVTDLDEFEEACLGPDSNPLSPECFEAIEKLGQDCQACACDLLTILNGGVDYCA